MTTTAYLDLFLRSISEPALLEIFLRFILLHQHENVHILDTLTSRINTPFRVRFQENLFWNRIMNILFSLPYPFFPPFSHYLFYFGTRYCILLLGVLLSGRWHLLPFIGHFSQFLGWHFLLWNQQNVLLRRHDAGEHMGISAGKAKEPECSKSGYQIIQFCILKWKSGQW